MVSARQILHLHAACAGAVNAIKEKFMMFTMWNNGKLVNKGIQNTGDRQADGWEWENAGKYGKYKFSEWNQ